MTTAAPFLSRQLGDYLLVAQLSEDALGTVFRALHAADERRFVRLRILRTNELPLEAVESAVRENAELDRRDSRTPRSWIAPCSTWSKTCRS